MTTIEKNVVSWWLAGYGVRDIAYFCGIEQFQVEIILKKTQGVWGNDH